jgi:cysteine desulfurase
MIYFDNNATTQVSAEVLNAMLPFFTEHYMNSSSVAAAYFGADKPREQAASALTRLLKAEEPSCFTFTSGATESNNWVLGPIASSLSGKIVVISSIEHPSITEPAEALSKRGFTVRTVPVGEEGALRLDQLSDCLNSEVALVSIMAANNETGAIQPIPQIGKLIRERAPAAIFHTDATQAVGKITIDLCSEWEHVDLLSFSAHKFHGPKGIGGLYARPEIDLPPMLPGGGQESGRRSGTSNTPALAGLAVAADLARKADMRSVLTLRDDFETALHDRFDQVIFHGRSTLRLPNTSCFSLPGFAAEDLAEEFAARGIVIGTGSACSTGTLHPPKTLLAMGIEYGIAKAALRLSLSRMNTQEHLAQLLTELTEIVSGNL